MHNHPAIPRNNLDPGAKRNKGRQRQKRNPSFNEVQEVHQTINLVDKINNYRQDVMPTTAKANVNTIITNLNKLGTRLLGSQPQSHNEPQNYQRSVMPVDRQNSSRQVNPMTQANQYVEIVKRKQCDSILKNVLYRPSQTVIADRTCAQSSTLLEPTHVQEYEYAPYTPLNKTDRQTYVSDTPDHVTQSQSEINYQSPNTTEVRSNQPYPLDFPHSYQQQRLEEEHQSLSPVTVENYRPYEPETTLGSPSRPLVIDDQFGNLETTRQMSYQPDSPGQIQADKDYHARNPLDMKKKYRQVYPHSQIKPRTSTDYDKPRYSNFTNSPEVGDAQSPIEPINNIRTDIPQVELDYHNAQFDSLIRSHRQEQPNYSSPYQSYIPPYSINVPLNLAKPSEDDDVRLSVDDDMPRVHIDLTSIGDSPGDNFTSVAQGARTDYRQCSYSSPVSSPYSRIENDSPPMAHHARQANIELPAARHDMRNRQNNNQPTPQSDNTKAQQEITEASYSQANARNDYDKNESNVTKAEKPPYFYYREHSE